MSIWTDPTNSVQAIKSDSGAPTGANTEWASADPNKIRQALLDIAQDVGPGPVTATGSTAARTLSARFADVVNVKDFGAVGDGVADDTAAIQAALKMFSSPTVAPMQFDNRRIGVPPPPAHSSEDS